MLSNVSELVKSECFKWLCVFVSVRREGIAVVCVSRVSAGAPWGAEEDPQLSQHQQQPDQHAGTVSTITQFMSVQQGHNKYYYFNSEFVFFLICIFNSRYV